MTHSVNSLSMLKLRRAKAHENVSLPSQWLCLVNWRLWLLLPVPLGLQFSYVLGSCNAWHFFISFLFPPVVPLGTDSAGRLKTATTWGSSGTRPSNLTPHPETRLAKETSDHSDLEPEAREAVCQEWAGLDPGPSGCPATRACICLMPSAPWGLVEQAVVWKTSKTPRYKITEEKPNKTIRLLY